MVAHRRCGKTVACVADLITRAATLKRKPGWAPGRYAYVAPLLGQAKDVAWEYLKAYAAPILAQKNEGELWVELINKARIRVYGADNPDRLRGGYLDGGILDEYADMRPSVLTQIVRPMLADRQGWLTLIGTPKGKNEFWKVWQRAQSDERWFTGMYRASETGLLQPAELVDAAKDMSEEEYAQEFECSFDAAILGAYFGKLMVEADRAGRIGRVAYDPRLPVQCAWDLGMGDSMVVWVFQVYGPEIRVLDVVCDHGKGLEFYVDWLVSRGWQRETTLHWLPHDAKVRELTTGKSRIEYLHDVLGLKCELVPNIGLEDGINAVRMCLPSIWWNVETCDEGIEAMRQYRREYDEKTKAFKDAPRHDWTSHYADGVRYMCVAARYVPPKPRAGDPKPLGVPMNQLTYDQLMELDGDAPERRERI